LAFAIVMAVSRPPIASVAALATIGIAARPADSLDNATSSTRPRAVNLKFLSVAAE